MSVEVEDCDLARTRNLPKEPEDDGELPLSSGFPAFTCLNRKRRVMCQICKTPIGYAGMDMCHIEAARCRATKETKLIKDDRLFGAVCIENPINVSLRPVDKVAPTNTQSGNQNKPFGSYVVENAQRKYSEGEEVSCDYCETVLGVRITEYATVRSMESGDWGEDDCGVVPERVERSRWFALSEDAIDIEPLFGLVGSDELSRLYHGGERFFSESTPIEDLEIFSNDSETWLQPVERRTQNASSDNQGSCDSWPRFCMDLVRGELLRTKGILGHTKEVDLAVEQVKDAFIKQVSLLKLADDSTETPRDCCSEVTVAFENNK